MNLSLDILSSGALLVKIDTGGKEGKSYEENQESAVVVVVAVVVPLIWDFLILLTVIRHLLQTRTAI